MKKALTEEKVLRKLGIQDFTQLNKDNIIPFTTMLPRMSPTVQKKALEQFPDFAATSLAVMREYKQILESAIKENGNSVKNCYEMHFRVMTALEKILDSDELTFQDKLLISDQMRELSTQMDMKDTENKKFLYGIVGVAGVVALGVVTVLSAALGGSDALGKVADKIGEKINM